MEGEIKTCCFTGHRPKSLPWGYNEESTHFKEYKARLEQIIEKAIKNGYNYFINGLAEGFDTYALEILIKMRDENKYEITIEGAIPCTCQDKLWSKESKERYRQLVKKLDKKTVISNEYTSSCCRERNEYMLSKSNLVISGFSGGTGGTLSTLRKAKEQGKTIIILNPKTMAIDNALV